MSLLLRLLGGGPPPAAPNAPVRVYLADQSERARVRGAAHSELRPPAAGPGGQANALIQLARRPRRAIFSRSKLYPPNLTQPAPSFVALPVRTSLADSRRQQTVQSELRPPTVLFYVAPPIRTRLAQSRRPQIVQSELRSPTTLAAVVAFVAVPVRATFARARRPQFVQSDLRSPSVVAPGIVFLPARRTLVRAQRPRPVLHRLYPPPSFAAIIPGVVGALVSLTRRNWFGGRYAIHSELRAPTVVDPFVPPPPPPQPQEPTNFGAFIDRRHNRAERREWLVTRRRGG
jgi:hypothetical protein